MRNTPKTKYPQDLPYCLSSDRPDPSSEFADKEGWLSPSKLYNYAYSNPSDPEVEELRLGEDHATYSARRHTLTYAASPGYVRLFRLVFTFTIGCLAAIVILQTIWGKPRMDTFDELFFSKFVAEEEHTDQFAQRWGAFMQHVLPIRCHSHNDYWRSTPLLAALASGCTSVEADVWAMENRLYVGHDAVSLMPEVTLASTYLDPIEKMLRAANENSQIGNVSTDGSHGVFGMQPDQSLVLLIDFKTEGARTYDAVRDALEPLRRGAWLTHWNGTHRVERPLTVVASGWVPFEKIVANDTYRDIFFDAPLNRLVSSDDYLPSTFPDAAPVSESSENSVRSGENDASMLGFRYNPSNSYYASTDLKGVVGYLSQYSVTQSNIETMKKQTHEARIRGLVPRYWGTPRWPRNFRDYTWEVLMESDVGVLNVDDLRAARKGQWGRLSHQS